MKSSVAASPYYGAWLSTIEEDIKLVKKGILERNFTTVGIISESNCLKMHALMWTTKPSVIYQNPLTIEIMNSVIRWREEGVECYFTMDAGPQVKIICLENNITKIIEKLESINVETIVTRPGQGAKTTNEHLF